MADSGVYDRWHRSRAPDGAVRCREHDLPPTADHGRGRRWLARWRDDVGKQCKQSFRRKADAEAHLVDVRGKLQTGLYVDPVAGRVTVTEYAKQWLPAQLHRDSTAALAERTLRLHVLAFLGHLRMADVRGSHLRAWVKSRSEVMAPGSLHLAYAYLRSMFRQAALDRVIGSSPCVGVKLPEIDRTDLIIPTTDQVHTLAAEVPGRFRAAVYLAAGCGLRAGEIFGLELDEVNFLGRELRVVRQLVDVGGRKVDGVTVRPARHYLAPPKTKTSRRTVELPEVVRLELAQHIERHPVEPVEVEDCTNPRKPVRRPARLLFTTTTGMVVDSRRWSNVWRQPARAAELPARTGLHALRHFYATRLIEAGASVKTVQLALGHAKASMTLDVYVGLWPEATDRARTILDEALADPGVPAACPEGTGEQR